MYAKTLGCTIDGLEGHVVIVEVDISPGLPMFEIVGLPGRLVKEARERVRGAIKNCGYTFPMKRIIVNLGPADLRKESVALDVPIAIAILIASGQIRKKDRSTIEKRAVMLGELGLDGTIKPVRAMLAMTMPCQALGIETIYCHPYHEKAVTPGLSYVYVDSLVKLIQALETDVIGYRPSFPVPTYTNSCGDYGDVKGQETGKRAMMIAACGFHPIWLVGPPGQGKTMLASRLPSIMPDLTEQERLEVTTIHSAAHSEWGDTIVDERPLRQPHHTVSASTMLGGGTPLRPGEITLAHQGVLFLDEAPLFKKTALEGLRKPMEEGYIQLHRHGHMYRFPSRFLLVLASNPCACGYEGHGNQPCLCTEYEVKKYNQAISGPLLDRLPMKLWVQAYDWTEANTSSHVLTSSVMKEQVLLGRKIQAKRFQNSTLNGWICSKAIEEICSITSAGLSLLNQLGNEMGLSRRSYDHIIRVSQTIADLEGARHIDIPHIAETMALRQQN